MLQLVTIIDALILWNSTRSLAVQMLKEIMSMVGNVWGKKSTQLNKSKAKLLIFYGGNCGIKFFSKLKQFETSWEVHFCVIYQIILIQQMKGSRLNPHVEIKHFIKKSAKPKMKLSGVGLCDINLCGSSGKELGLYLHNLCMRRIIAYEDYRERNFWTEEHQRFIISNFWKWSFFSLCLLSHTCLALKWFNSTLNIIQETVKPL